MKKNTENSTSAKRRTKVKIFTKKKKIVQPENIVIEKLKSQYGTIDTNKVTNFVDLPISQKTIKALKESKYLKLTDIQKASIPLALQGKDILGAAQTGSGKTLAFLIPILECLYCEQWTRIDGIGALVITPTRELAYQIFETLRKVGKYQDFSAGLIIGGKDLKFERKRMDQCNIVICTPGRLLQHMDENPLFDCVNMKILVLDEADRCLDMGFKESMNAIIANLPPKRQTLLFSATQTKSVQDLARLSLKDPSYVSINEMTTPKELQQSYVICELQDKLSILWSFIRNHLKQKTIIFFSTCKQVKYFYELFCKLSLGLTLLPLYGTLHQLRRMKIYEDFCRKQSAVLFATDLAARGLDFPEVHWVVQADCPEDIETYIHRVGRTARYHKGGESLLLLMPSELKMIEYLEEKKIPIETIDINPSKLQNPIRKIEAFLARDSALKDTAQRAVSHYAKAVFFMKHKEVFNIQALDLESFSKSLGLTLPPRIRFLDRLTKKQQFLSGSGSNASKIEGKSGLGLTENNQNKKTYFQNNTESDVEQNSKNDEAKDIVMKLRKSTITDSSEDSGILESEDDVPRVKLSKVNLETVDTEGPLKNKLAWSDSDGEDDELDVKRRDHQIEVPAVVETFDLPLAEQIGFTKKKKPITKVALVKQMLKKRIIPNKKIVFDEEGAAIAQGIEVKKSDLAQALEKENTGGIDVEKAKLVLREEDKFDKQKFQAQVKAKHKDEKRKLKELKKKEQEAERDEFGESEDDEGPDLSWLPDPNKIYGEKANDSDNNSESRITTEPMDMSEKEEGPNLVDKIKKHKKGKKRKHKGPDNLETVLKRKKEQRVKQLSANLDVNETEELALMLLKGKK